MRISDWSSDVCSSDLRYGFAAVGRQRPRDHLADIVIDRPPLVNRRDDGGEIVVQQNHFGGLTGGLGSLDAPGRADIGLLERGRVVDAVPGHGDDRAEIGRASWRDRECPYRSISGVAASLKKNNTQRRLY